MAGFKHVKSRDETAELPLSSTRRKNLYLSVIAQVALRTMHEVFEADRSNKVGTVTVSGYVAATDPATGTPSKAYLVSVSAERSAFETIDLAHVEPVACLQGLGGTISRSSLDKVPIKPKVDLSRVAAEHTEQSLETGSPR